MEQKSTQAFIEETKDITSMALGFVNIWSGMLRGAELVGRVELVEIAHKGVDFAFLQLSLITASTSQARVSPRDTLYLVFNRVEEMEAEISIDPRYAKEVRDIVWALMEGLRQSDDSVFRRLEDRIARVADEIHAELMQLQAKYDALL